jgi:hypothetical protein
VITEGGRLRAYRRTLDGSWRLHVAALIGVGDQRLTVVDTVGRYGACPVWIADAAVP